MVHTYDEWSPLKEVIVGSAKNYCSHDREVSFDIFFHENLFRSDWAYPRLKKSTSRRAQDRTWQIKTQYVEELDEDDIDLIDASLPDDHPDAPYDRVKELAILRESIDAMNAGEVGIPLDEAMAQIARNLNLPSSRRE